MASITLVSVNDVVYELGVRSIKAFLREQGHHVRLVFVNESVDDLTDETLAQLSLVAAESSLIGISLLTHSLGKAIKVTTFLKQNHPSTPVIWGGIHATSYPEDCLKYADLVCLGEGEYPIAELAEALEIGDSYEEIANLCFLTSDGRTHKNPPRPPITDLDSLPYMDYTLDDEYALEQGAVRPMTQDLLRDKSLGWNLEGVEHMHVAMSARGCPFNCTFCCNDVWHKLYGAQGGRIRKRSIASFVEELADVTSRLSFFSGVVIEDDSFLCRSIDEIREFAALYRDRVGMPFGIQMNPNEVSVEKLTVLSDAGLAIVHVGVQSGDDTVRRKYYHRFTSEKKIIETNRVLSNLGILHKFDIILDTPFPGDTRASFELVRQLRGPFTLNLYSLRVYPGLAIYQLIKDAGYDEWLAANDDSVSYFAISSDEAYTFALKRYVIFPPTWQSMVIRKVVSSWPTGVFWAYRHLGGTKFFALYGHVRNAFRWARGRAR